MTCTYEPSGASQPAIHPSSPSVSQCAIGGVHASDKIMNDYEYFLKVYFIYLLFLYNYTVRNILLDNMSIINKVYEYRFQI